MEVMGNGWIKLHRELLDHWVYDDPEKLKIWITLLSKASHQKHTINVGYELVELSPGELIFGTIKFANAINISRDKLYRTVKMFEKDGMIKYDTSTYQGKFSIIKILNWGKYQKPSSPTCQEDSDFSQKGDKRVAEGEQTPDKRSTNGEQTPNKTNNKDNNVKNVKNDNNNIVPKSEIDKIYNSLSDYFRPLFKDYIDIYRQQNKTKKITDNKHLRLLKELNDIFKKKSFKYDGHNYNLTDEVFEKGIDGVVEKQIDNLNYAKKIWISEMERLKKREEQKKKKRQKVKSGSYQNKSETDGEDYKYKDFFIDFDKYKE